MSPEKLSASVTKRYAAQLVYTIDYLQHNEIMHRDLKPENIMLDDNLNLKLVTQQLYFLLTGLLCSDRLWRSEERRRDTTAKSRGRGKQII